MAWSEDSKQITYLFTQDLHVITDSELGVGGGCRLVDEADNPYELVHYMDWLITPAWADTIADLSGDAIWYAALARDPRTQHYGRIKGFVQSKYLKEKMAVRERVH